MRTVVGAERVEGRNAGSAFALEEVAGSETGLPAASAAMVIEATAARPTARVIGVRSVPLGLRVSRSRRALDRWRGR